MKFYLTNLVKIFSLLDTKEIKTNFQTEIRFEMYASICVLYFVRQNKLLKETVQPYL